MNVDADERLDTPLQGALQEMIAREDVAGWRFARRPYLIGFGYTPIGVEERANLRLIRRGRGHYDTSQRVHEGIVLHGLIKEFHRGSLLHYRPLLMDQQILKENRYSSLKADQFVAEAKQARVLKLVFSPIIYFLRLYLWNGLWKCGVPGFIQAMTGAVYAFLTQAKIHQRYAVRHKPNVDDWRQQIAVAPLP